MQEAQRNNPYIPQKEEHTSTHIMNVHDLKNKDKPKYIAKNWYDKLPILLLIGLLISAVSLGLSYLLAIRELLFITPLFPVIFLSIWLVRRLFHGKNLDPIK